MPEVANALRACHCCGLIQAVGALALGERAHCGRCGVVILDPSRRGRSNALTAAAATAALILYPLAITLPILRTERLGRAHNASIWEGAIELLARGELFVGVVVLVCSVVVPLLKLVLLLAITGGRRWLARGHRATTYRWIERAGRWGMLDVLLIAVVVAWVKLRDLVDVRPGPAALAFTLVVLLSLVASAQFDPHAVWDEPGAAPLERPANAGQVRA